MIKNILSFGKWMRLLLLLSVLFSPNLTLALEGGNYQTLNYNIDQKTLERGFTFSFQNRELLIPLLPKRVKDPFSLQVVIEDKNSFTLPENTKLLSEVYTVKIENTKEEGLLLPLIFTLSEKSLKPKALYSFDLVNGWQKITKFSGGKDRIILNEKITMITLAILEEQSEVKIGEASWYRYKNCDCAASPDYPKGTLLAVKNLDNGKEIIVKVNDFGPDQQIFPARIIDLDRTAFQKLANPRMGIIKNVQVTPVYIQK